MNQITVELKNASADWVDEPMVQDDIITYSKPMIFMLGEKE